MSEIALVWSDSITLPSLTAKKVLTTYARLHRKDKPIEISISDLEKKLGISKTAIYRAIDTLIEHRLITKHTQHDERGGQLPNLVYLKIPQTFIDEYTVDGVTK